MKDKKTLITIIVLLVIFLPIGLVGTIKHFSLPKQLDNGIENPNKEFNWWESFKDIDFEIVDECITKNCIENWDDFIAKIHKINWE